MRSARRWLPLVVVVVLVSCSDAGPPPEPPLAVDDALVGTWVGPIELTNPPGLQPGTMTMELNGDGSMSVSVDNPFYKPINSGTWGVSGNEFSAVGPDTQGTEVLFTAPRSTTQLDGTWRTSGGQGNFGATKQ